MHKLILIAALAVSLSSCKTYKQVPLSKVYKSNPVAIVKVPGLLKDQAWDRAVRLFAERNISIKMIDKSSGFIQSDLVSFVTAYQIDSAPVPPYPVYVLTQQESGFNTVLQPSYITGYLKVFILNDSSQTEVRVNIEDLRSYHIAEVHHRSSVTYNELNRTVVSTGTLESQVAEYISTGRYPIYDLRIQNGVVLNPNENYSQYVKKKQDISGITIRRYFKLLGCPCDSDQCRGIA
jgi:hypothetical protein